MESEATNAERVRMRGDGLYGGGVSGGLAVLLSDETLLEFGLLREWAWSSSRDTIDFGDPLDPSEADLQVEPSGLMVFFALSVAF